MSMPLTRNAGEIRPLGPRTSSRAAGSASSLTLIRSTAATSPWSTGATAHGSLHHASTGTTRKPVRGMNSSGRVAITSTPPGSTPTSSAASRSAAATGPESSASMAPPGKAGCPACSRSPWLRWMNSRSGPSGPSANRTSTADGLPPRSGGKLSRDISIVLAAAASSCNHAGARAGCVAPGGRPVTRTGQV
jgi:hypothetical protein